MLIIDTDAGTDDFLAISIALETMPEDILGISAVYGNVSVGQAVENIAYFLQLSGRGDDIPIWRGAATPLQHDAVLAQDIHGADGLGAARSVVPQLSSTEWHDSLSAFLSLKPSPEAKAPPIDLLFIGPCTNGPALVDAIGTNRIGRVVIMGGSIFDVGNITPQAEFNVYNDPEAFRYMLTSGLDVTLVPLDITRKVQLGTSLIQGMGGTSASDLILALREAMLGYATAYGDLEGIDGCYAHDALAWLVMRHPERFKLQKMSVDVCVSDDKTRGELRLAEGGTADNPSSEISVALGADWKWVRETITSYLRSG